MGYPLLVQMERFELSSFRRRILSPLCMPFHHICSLHIITSREREVNGKFGSLFPVVFGKKVDNMRFL